MRTAIPTPLRALLTATLAIAVAVIGLTGCSRVDEPPPPGYVEPEEPMIEPFTFQQVGQAIKDGDTVYAVVGSDPAPNRTIVRVPSGGGEAEEIYTAPDEFVSLVIHLVSDGLLLVDTQWYGDGGSDLLLLDVKTGETRPVVETVPPETLLVGAVAAGGQVFYQELTLSTDTIGSPFGPDITDAVLKRFDPATGESTQVAELERNAVDIVGTSDAAYWIEAKPLTEESNTHRIVKYSVASGSVEQILDLGEEFRYLVRGSDDSLLAMAVSDDDYSIVRLDGYDGKTWNALTVPGGQWTPFLTQANGDRMATIVVTLDSEVSVERLVVYDSVSRETMDHPVVGEDGSELSVTAFYWIDDETIGVYSQTPFDPAAQSRVSEMFFTIVHLGQAGTSG